MSCQKSSVVQETIEKLMQNKPLNLSERNKVIAKLQLCSENREELLDLLRGHYLPLVATYYQLYQEAFPDQINTEEKALEVLEDGFFFLDKVLRSYIYDKEYCFKTYFSSVCRKHFRYLKNTPTEQNDDLSLTSLRDELNINLDDILVSRQMNSLVEEVLDQVQSLPIPEKTSLVEYYDLHGDSKKARKKTYMCNQGVKTLQEYFPQSKKQLVYKYNNRHKVIK